MEKVFLKCSQIHRKTLKETSPQVFPVNFVKILRTPPHSLRISVENNTPLPWPSR